MAGNIREWCASGALRGGFGITQDITHHKAVEEALKRPFILFNYDSDFRGHSQLLSRDDVRILHVIRDPRDVLMVGLGGGSLAGQHEGQAHPGDRVDLVEGCELASRHMPIRTHDSSTDLQIGVHII